MAQNFLGGLSAFPSMGARHHHHHGHPHGHAPMSPRMQQAYGRANQTAMFVAPDMPGAPARDAAILPAAWPVQVFALANGTNIVNLQTNVQTPFRGQRFVVLVIRNGTSAAVSAPLIQTLIIGQKPLITTGFPIPAEAYIAGAFDTNLVFPPTYPGVIYSQNVLLSSALTTTDTITYIS
jgi:hypothetical protein